jgi:DNA-directed RNA polymerase subunit M/transcription elongation factor TFIIS
MELIMTDAFHIKTKCPECDTEIEQYILVSRPTNYPKTDLVTCDHCDKVFVMCVTHRMPLIECIRLEVQPS